MCCNADTVSGGKKCSVVVYTGSLLFTSAFGVVPPSTLWHVKSKQESSVWLNLLRFRHVWYRFFKRTSEINCILLVALSGVGGHQWSGRPPAAQVLKICAASSLSGVDVWGESSSRLSRIIPYSSQTTPPPRLTAPPLTFSRLISVSCLTIFLWASLLHLSCPYLFTSDSSGLKAKVPAAPPQPKSPTYVCVR